MPYRQMDIKETAKLLGMDARRVERMAQRGEIPCQKVGGQLRFNRAQLTEWFQENLGDHSHENLASVDAGLGAHRELDPHEPITTPLLRIEAIATHLPARTRHSVLRELVTVAEKTGLVYHPEGLLEALEEREELCPTALEAGIAIPHPRRPLPYDIAEPILVVARTSQGIGFGASDGRLSDLFFLTASQDDRHHLHILARLCRMLHKWDFIDQLRHAETPEEMMTLMTERETEVIQDA